MATEENMTATSTGHPPKLEEALNAEKFPKVVDKNSAKGDGQKQPRVPNLWKQNKQPTSRTPAASGSQQTLTNAEKKALQKAEKAARRAQAKAAVTSQPLKDIAGEQKTTKGKPNDAATQGPLSTALSKRRMPVHEMIPEIPECFTHLPMAKRISILQADKDVNPAILILGQQMASFAITDPIGRLHSTLLALKKVIEDYITPQGSSFSRHFTPHGLNPQIEYLTACRPMSFGMRNAVRWLKAQIIAIDVDEDEMEAKKTLKAKIDQYIKEKIVYADQAILSKTRSHINDGDVVLTFGCHRLVEAVIREAHFAGIKFKVLIIDDPVSNDGQELSKLLISEGMDVSHYSSVRGVQLVLKGATTVLLGAEAMFQNGSMYARSGSADIAMCAHSLGIPVIVLCHSVNYTERVAIDSLTYNEIDPDKHTEAEFRLLFDTTNSKYITNTVTEQGWSDPRSAGSITRTSQMTSQQ